MLALPRVPHSCEKEDDSKDDSPKPYGAVPALQIHCSANDEAQDSQNGNNISEVHVFGEVGRLFTGDLRPSLRVAVGCEERSRDHAPLPSRSIRVILANMFCFGKLQIGVTGRN